LYRLRAQGYEVRVAVSGFFDRARNTPARFDLNLSVSDCAGNVTACTDQQPLAYNQIAIEPAAHIGVLSRCMAVEEPSLSNNHVLAFLQSRMDRALHNQTVAGIDLARQGNPLPNNESPAVNFMSTRTGGCLARLLRRSRAVCTGGDWAVVE